MRVREKCEIFACHFINKVNFDVDGVTFNSTLFIDVLCS